MSDFQLTPIGTSPAWYNPGEPCSGFLLEADDRRVLVDCGSGVIARYLTLFGGEHPIDDIVLSHVHADHCFDLVPLKFAMDYGQLAHWRPRLWLPPGARERLTRLVSAWDEDFSYFEQSFDVREYSTEAGFEVGPFAASACLVPHYVECFALRFEHADASFGYTADLGPSPDVAGFMSGVDLLLAEAAFAEDGDLDLPERGHITASEAGAIARDAGACSLLLTHVPAELGFDRSLAAARSAFAGPVGLARSGDRYVVAAHLAAAG